MNEVFDRFPDFPHEQVIFCQDPGVEGLGKVGYHLARLLVGAGARVVAAEVSAPARHRAARDAPGIAFADRVLDADVDVYAPCALGAWPAARRGVPVDRARAHPDGG